jgi:hypothetical protein
LDLIAKWYLVLVVDSELNGRAEPFDYREYQQVEQIISRLAGTNPDILLAKTGGKTGPSLRCQRTSGAGGRFCRVDQD